MTPRSKMVPNWWEIAHLVRLHRGISPCDACPDDDDVAVVAMTTVMMAQQWCKGSQCLMVKVGLKVTWQIARAAASRVSEPDGGRLLLLDFGGGGLCRRGTHYLPTYLVSR